MSDQKNNLDLQKQTLESKWGKDALSMGWSAIPTSLFFLQGALNMTPTTFNVLLHLIIHWWKPYDWPHPSQESIAVRMGVSSRTVQRSLQELENYGLLTKIRTSKDNPKYKGRNIYDMSLLVKSLNILTPDLNAKLNEK
ncbi:helix-turn-helix domain-containing protein [Enterobacter cloacae complex sp. IR5476]|uniref:helix-turn-helix domain-containing protein n=1 Tax=Enterobacter cloacae complex sp. IR5476 TaxID=3412378 RepID=UPI003B9BB174